jgi:hypothetical protein
MKWDVFFIPGRNTAPHYGQQVKKTKFQYVSETWELKAANWNGFDQPWAVMRSFITANK